MANLLHDYEHEKEAAEALEPLVKMVLKEGRMSQLSVRTREYYHDKVGELPSPEELAARFHFYQACQFKNEKDLQRARGEYELAIKFDPKDADVLIDMYKFPDADPKWRAAALERVNKLVKQFEKEIE